MTIVIRAKSLIVLPGTKPSCPCGSKTMTMVMFKDPACPCCGDFVRATEEQENFKINKKDKDFFTP